MSLNKIESNIPVASWQIPRGLGPFQTILWSKIKTAEFFNVQSPLFAFGSFVFLFFFLHMLFFFYSVSFYKMLKWK